MKTYQLSQFRDLYEKLSDTTLPIKTAYKLNKLARKVDDELKIYQEMLVKLLREFCEFNEDGSIRMTDDGKSYKLKDGKVGECNEKLSELNEMEIEMPNVTFSVDELESLNLSMKEMNCLMPFIEE